MVETRNGPYAIAGDTVYWYSNVEKMWPPGYNQGNSFNQIHTYRTMREALKKETSRIVPGHDPLVWSRHKSWAAESGNQVAEVNLRENDSSREPRNSVSRVHNSPVSGG
jgi:glyoxylase-like metal-dependent hydrolase (beta-lactamase superfamily II)